MSHYSDYYNISSFRSEHIAMLDKITALGPKFAERAQEIDLNASFPTQNYVELKEAGFLKLVIPEEFGGYEFSLGEYATIGAEIGKYCGATALTFNMHTSSMMWLRFMYDMPNLTKEEKQAFARMRELQFPKVVNDGAIFSQPISEGGVNWTSDPIQTNCRKTKGVGSSTALRNLLLYQAIVTITLSSVLNILKGLIRAMKTRWISLSIKTLRGLALSANGILLVCAAQSVVTLF